MKMINLTAIASLLLTTIAYSSPKLIPIEYERPLKPIGYERPSKEKYSTKVIDIHFDKEMKRFQKSGGKLGARIGIACRQVGGPLYCKTGTVGLENSTYGLPYIYRGKYRDFIAVINSGGSWIVAAAIFSPNGEKLCEFKKEFSEASEDVVVQQAFEKLYSPKAKTPLSTLRWKSEKSCYFAKAVYKLVVEE